MECLEKNCEGERARIISQQVIAFLRQNADLYIATTTLGALVEFQAIHINEFQALHYTYSACGTLRCVRSAHIAQGNPHGGCKENTPPSVTIHTC